MRILVVEDEVQLAETLADILKKQKYLVDVAYDGERGLENSMSGIYDAIVLDVMLPKVSGFNVVRRLRLEGDATPVLLLTARRSVEDKVTGLDCGADYYLTKPFSTDELLACIRSLTRRRGDTVSDELQFGDAILDIRSNMLSCGNKSVLLSSHEFAIMRILMANSRAIIPKETLLTRVWGYESDATENHVEVFVTFLRKKLTHIGSDVKISAVRRVGYRLEVKVC